MKSKTKVSGAARVAMLALLLVGLMAVVAPLVQAQDVLGPVVVRPIEEFVEAQGTYCFDLGDGCILFEPPVQNFLGQSDPVRGLSMSVDYAGLADKWIVENGGESIGTAFSGTIRERSMTDGRAKVDVVLNTKKALVWVKGGADFSGPLLFGHTAPDVLAGEKPDTCSSTFKVTFINTAPGAPMPDLIQMLIAPAPGQEFRAFSTNCNARGHFHADYGVPEGTPGRAISKQVAKTIDGSLIFTTENIRLKVQQ